MRFPCLVLEIFEIKVFTYSMALPYMVVLIPYKEMVETSNWNISKTTHRNPKIFSEMIILINIIHFMQKKVGVKKWAHFPD